MQLHNYTEDLAPHLLKLMKIVLWDLRMAADILFQVYLVSSKNI